MTMQLIQTVTVGVGGATSINFSSIPQTGTDLFIVASVRTADAAPSTNLIVKFNSLTTGYSSRLLNGSGSAVSSTSTASMTILVNSATATSNTFGNASLYIPNYTATGQKPMSSDSVIANNSTAGGLRLSASSSSDTAPITSIQFENGSVNILENSTISLYKITKGSGGATVS